jgi:hypothetical protein
VLHLQAPDAVLREHGEHAGVRVRDDAHGPLRLGAVRVVVAHHELPVGAGRVLQRLGAEAEPLGEEPEQGAGDGGGADLPLEHLGAAGGRDPVGEVRVAVGAQQDLDGVAPAGRGGVVQVDVGGVVDPAVHGAAVVRRALVGGEFVEGAHRREGALGVVVVGGGGGRGEGVVVVDEVEEAPGAGGRRGGRRGEVGREGEVYDGDGNAGRGERDGGVGVRVAEELRDGRDARLHEASHARAGVVEGLEELGAAGRGRREGGGRHRVPVQPQPGKTRMMAVDAASSLQLQLQLHPRLFVLSPARGPSTQPLTLLESDARRQASGRAIAL